MTLSANMSDMNSRLAHAIRAELGHGPEAQGWTIEDLTMPRLVQLCQQVGVPPEDLLTRALARVESDEDDHRTT